MRLLYSPFHRDPGCWIYGRSPAASSFAESRLAWLLAETASPFLDADQHHDMFVAIGIGDTFTAIALALDAISRAGGTIDRHIATRLETWLNAYIGHDDEGQLRSWIHQLAAA